MDSDFWRDFAEKFRALDPTTCLRLEWRLFLPEERYEKAVIGTGERCRTIKVQFETLATRAGIRLAGGSDSLTGLARWIDELIRSSPNDRPLESTGIDEEGNEKSKMFSGMIMRLCEASADLCNIFESRALEMEETAAEEERQRNDPRNWPPLVQELKAIESIKNLYATPPKEISEVLVRSLIAQRTGIKPEDVPWSQIQFEVTGLFQHYGHAIKLVSQPNAPSNPAPDIPPKTNRARLPRTKLQRRSKKRLKTVPQSESKRKRTERSQRSGNKKSGIQTVRARVDAFIEAVFEMRARRITRTDIWRVAGYTEATQFERFQRSKNQSAGSVVRFDRVLKMSPAEFVERLDRLKK